MKTHHHILTLLLTLLNSLVVFAYTNDSTSVKPVPKKDAGDKQKKNNQNSTDKNGTNPYKPGKFRRSST